ncbi:MAG: hypothetical protein AAFQ87_11640 [Bacteroidota bacterium]
MFIRYILFALLLGLAFRAAAQDQYQEWYQQSNLVVMATVKQVGKAHFDGVPPSERNVVVVIEAVLKSSGNLPLAKGQELTVLLRDQSSAKEGDQAIFYTLGWIIGKGIAVQEIGREPIKDPQGELGAIQKRMGAYEQAANRRELRAHIQQSDLVAMARVVQIEERSSPKEVKLSEHNPGWTEAIVKVEEGLKGTKAAASVVVRFPASMDVHFYGVPQLEKGQEAVLLLERDNKISGKGAFMSYQGQRLPVYVIRQPMDVLDAKRFDEVKRAMP